MKNIDGFTRGMIRRICFATIVASVLLAPSCKKEIEPTLKERQNAPKESALSRWLATTNPEWIPFVLNRARPKNGAAEGEGAVSDLLKSLMTIDKAEKYYRAQLLSEGYRPAELDSLLLSPAGKGPSPVSEALFVSYMSIGQTGTKPRGAWPDGKGGYLDEVEIRACRVPSDIQLFQRVVGGPPNQVFDPRIQRSPAELCKQRAMSNLSMLYNELRNKHNPSDMECNRIQMDIQRLMQEYFACDTNNPEGNSSPSGSGSSGGNGDSSGQINLEDPGEKYELFVIEDPILLDKRFNCFNNVPTNSSTTYSIKICTDIPVNSNPKALLNSNREPGHTFLELTKTNGGISVTETIGFYPEKYIKAAFQLPVNSMIVDNQYYPYDASLIMAVNANQFAQILTTAKENAGNDYQMTGYNCTTFALDVFNSARASNNKLIVPNTVPPNTVFRTYGKTPNGLYNVIKTMADNNASGASVVAGKGKTSTDCGP